MIPPILRQKRPLGRAAAKKSPDGTKLERDFRDLLELRKRAGDIVDFYREPFNLRLAKNTYYRPDFLAIEKDLTLTVYECKGFWEDDARVKIKVAADQHSYLRFVAVQRKGKSWIYEEI